MTIDEGNDPRLQLIGSLLEIAEQHALRGEQARERHHDAIADRYFEIAAAVRTAGRIVAQQRINLLSYEHALALEHAPCRQPTCPYCRRRALQVLPGGAS